MEQAFAQHQALLMLCRGGEGHLAGEPQQGHDKSTQGSHGHWWVRSLLNVILRAHVSAAAVLQVLPSCRAHHKLQALLPHHLHRSQRCRGQGDPSLCSYSSPTSHPGTPLCPTKPSTTHGSDGEQDLTPAQPYCATIFPLLKQPPDACRKTSTAFLLLLSRRGGAPARLTPLLCSPPPQIRSHCA